jgi:molybdate transport system substrate-binding protein
MWYTYPISIYPRKQFMVLSARVHHLIVTLVVCFTLAGTAACQGGKTQSELTVAAASSLAPVFQEMGEEFTSQTGIPVIFSFGSSGQLAQQIRNGAPFDIFASADEGYVDELIADGHLSADSRLLFAQGVLVLVAPSNSTLDSLEDALQSCTGRIVIANPEHAPYGVAAQQVLERSGRWSDLLPRLVFTETVRQATQVVETGNAAMGLVALSTALTTDLRIIDIDPQSYEPIHHVAAMASRSERAGEAMVFLQFLTSERGAELLRSHGLEPAHGS